VCDEPVGCCSGTDFADCTAGNACSDTCFYAFDGYCDDGGFGADYAVCALGTDCADCGARF
jgi:hypothetical protein